VIFPSPFTLTSTGFASETTFVSPTRAVPGAAFGASQVRRHVPFRHLRRWTIIISRIASSVTATYLSLLFIAIAIAALSFRRRDGWSSRRLLRASRNLSLRRQRLE
jgi:hypothetical protein